MHIQKRPLRRGFTVLEVVIAVAIAAMVMGGAMILFSQGSRSFAKTTAHAAVRTEALILLEKIGRDLQELTVSTGIDPETGRFHLLAPYQLYNEIQLQVPDPDTGAPTPVKAGRGLRFYRLHHVEMDTARSDVAAPDGRPTLVAHRVEYLVRPIPGDEHGRVDLLRNGKKINQMPLADVFFRQEPPVVASSQLGGCRNAILNVTVVPRGKGLLGFLEDHVIQRLRENGRLVSRTFHLVGYESLYTAVLYRAIEKVSRGAAGGGLGGLLGSLLGGAAPADDDEEPEPPTELEAAVLADASEAAPGHMLENIVEGLFRRASPGFRIPDVIRLEPTLHDDANLRDEVWESAPLEEAPPLEERS
jgi:prepilin-type N-terminal cleavage/methylation domain-containing protein